MKIFQLYDTMLVRHGLMLVGPTGGGKTENYKALQAACGELAPLDTDTQEQKEANIFRKVKTHILNPKGVLSTQLYGCLDI